MQHLSHAVYQETVSASLANWHKRRARAPEKELVEAALCLLRLDLDPLAPALAALYSPNPRGRPPWDPTCMLRAFLLMTLLRYTSLPQFAADLQRKPRLATLAGFAPHNTPSVGAFYLFIDRLEDGPYQATCPHRVKPSTLRKGQHRRNLSQEKAQKEAAREAILAECDSITGQLKRQLFVQAAQARPRDLQQRLEDLLLQTAVSPSAQRGLLGPLDQLKLCGDGSSLRTGANPAGKPTCQCRTQGNYRCACDRYYRDPSADWGYDSYHNCYYFGHTYYQHVVSSSGHDLPVHVTIGPASETDFTLSLKSLDRFRKACAENQLDLTVYSGSYDSGHDATGIYEYLLAKEIRPVIALNPRSGTKPKPSGTAERINAAGVPLCPAGLEMRRHTQTPNHRIIYHCPVKRPTHLEGKHVWQAHVEECPFQVLCQPDTKMGPTVYVRADTDPRFYPEIARGSPEYKELMNLRSGCERSNSSKKVAHKLGDRVCRSATHFLVRLYLVSIVEHAKAWLAEDRKVLGTDWRDLSDPEKIQGCARARPAPG
jgi:hypothetical protein